MQTRKGSFVEAIFNVLIGLSINLTANMLIFPLFGWKISFAQNLGVGAIYTVISIVRSYVIRRWFNSMIHNAAQRISS